MMSEIPKPQTMQIIQSIKSMHSGFKLISVTVFYFLGHYYYTLNSGFHWINWVLKKFYTNMHPTCPIPICSMYSPNQFFSAVTANVANISCNYLLSKPRLQLYSVWNMFVFQSKWFKSICLLGWRLITNFVISPNATITDGKASLKSLTRFEIRSLWQEGETLTYIPQFFFHKCVLVKLITYSPIFTSFKTDLYQGA